MKRLPLVPAVLAAAVLVLSAAATAQSSGEATRVAVVDLQQVIDQSAQQKAYQQQNTAKGEELKAENDRRRAELQSMLTQLEPLNPGSEPWLAKRDEIQEKQTALQVWVQVAEQQANLERARQFATLYMAASEATAKVAQAQGIDLVLQGGAMPDLMRLNPEQLQSVAQNRKVIYASDAADITQAVLARVDAEYKAR